MTQCLPPRRGNGREDECFPDEEHNTSIHEMHCNKACSLRRKRDVAFILRKGEPMPRSMNASLGRKCHLRSTDNLSD
jgi:hypothetical protein